jgi:hypothetical protein
VDLARLFFVDSLDADFGSRWRTGSKRQHYYSTRKVVVDEIPRQAGTYTDPACAVAAEILEERRLAKILLNKIFKLLRQNAQTRQKVEAKTGAETETGTRRRRRRGTGAGAS